MLGVNIEGVIRLGVNAGEYTRVGDSTGKGVGPCTGNLPAGWRLGICVSTVGISADPDIMVAYPGTHGRHVLGTHNRGRNGCWS